MVGLLRIPKNLYFIIFVCVFIVFEKNILKIFTSTADSQLDNDLIDLRSFNFLNEPYPKICQECKDGFLIIITIVSDLENYSKRNIIRKTWGNSSDCVKTIFLIGASDDSFKNKQINSENILNKDIVQGNFIDNYKNMTYKHVMDLKWVAHRCASARYVIKIDDDFDHLVPFEDAVPDVQKMYDLLKFGIWPQKNLIACKVYNTSKVHRKHSKWAVSQKKYTQSSYPPRCAGVVVIYSADVVRRLLEESRNVPYFWIDDVHVTGTLAERIGIKHMNFEPIWFISLVDLGRES